jgi:hypothetical protein
MVPFIEIDDTARETGERDIPAQFRQLLLPDGHTSVSVFVSRKLPSLRNATTFSHIDILNSYRTEEPSEDPSCLLGSTIPSRDFVKEIEQVFEQLISITPGPSHPQIPLQLQMQLVQQTCFGNA